MKSAALKIMTIEESPLLSKRVHSIPEEIEGMLFLGNARTIPSAFLFIQEKNPDVVMIDVQIVPHPKMGHGIELLVLLKKTFPGMILIVLKNCIELYKRINCRANGASYFYDKSNDLSKMANTLKDLHSGIFVNGQKQTGPMHSINIKP